MNNDLDMDFEDSEELQNRFISVFWENCKSRNVGREDLMKMPATVFLSLLSVTGDEVFGSRCELLRALPYERKSERLISNNNSLRRDIINDLSDMYISLSFAFNQIPSIYSFTRMMGISRETLYSWSGNTNNMQASEGNDITKKIHEASEYALTGRLTDGRQNPVGVLGVLNHFHGWNESADNKPEPRKITLQEMRESLGLSLQDGQNAEKSIRQIAQSPETQ